VSEEDALDLWLRYRQSFRPPARVAVLLPDSGGLKVAGAAIRDGIMSAYLENPAGAEIRFYGTGEETDSVLAAYFEAADDGAQWIIGPLDRASVEALLNLAGLATPVLALNDLPDRSLMPVGLAQQVYGMSLSQESEAAAIARQMADLGLDRTILLAPENTWGERIAQAFQDEFLQENRNILMAVRYLPEENDHSQVLERALRIDESKARKQQLENRLGIELEFEPVRRSDIDAIFLAATPEQGRLLAPQLRFFEAGDIPTFATSRVYTGRPDPTQNQDLDGLYVPLTTWQIEHATGGSIPDLSSLRGGEFAALYAIGLDAWNILPWLELMRHDPGFRFPGATGQISIVEGGNLRRKPSWGRFRNGVPVGAPPPGSTTETASRDW
jgi:outer membrane PBP1 activator LpoA protein